LVKVFLICITTACGRITPGNIGSPRDRRHLEDMRMTTDASLLGAGTLREGDPEMRGTGGIIPKNRIRAVITMSGRIPVEGRRLFQMSPPPVVFTSRDQAPSLGKALGHRARVVSLPKGTHGLSVGAAISDLGRMGARTVLIEGGAMLNYAALSEALPEGIHGLSVGAAISDLGRMGARTVLIEGGARLNYAALSERIVDEIYLTIAPKVSGEEGAASLADGPRHLGEPFLSLKLLECHTTVTGEVFLRYKVGQAGKWRNKN
jgi:riboflavin biosynthesis pyrimidine reductase